MDNPEIEDDDKKYFRIGGALDCLLTDPDRWEIDFEVVDAVKPWGLMGKFVDNLPTGQTIFSSRDSFQEAYDKSGYKMKLDTVISKFWENTEAVNYYRAISGIENKIIISKDEYEIVLKAKELILANEFLRCFFTQCNDTTQILHQVPIYFDYRLPKEYLIDNEEGSDIPEACKVLLDGIVVDHENKTIQPFDLKTIGKSVYEFPISFLQYGYYRQCALYELALYSDDSPVLSLIQDGYKVLDFIFIVVETKLSSSHPAIIYRTNSRDRECGLNGGWVGKRFYKGINQLIADYKYHRDNDYWDLPLDLLKSKGEIELNIFEHAEEHVIPNTDDEL